LFTCVREVFKYMNMVCHKIHKLLIEVDKFSTSIC
jgi:hypothetical protein